MGNSWKLLVNVRNRKIIPQPSGRPVCDKFSDVGQSVNTVRRRRRGFRGSVTLP